MPPAIAAAFAPKARLLDNYEGKGPCSGMKEKCQLWGYRIAMRGVHIHTHTITAAYVHHHHHHHRYTTMIQPDICSGGAGRGTACRPSSSTTTLP